MMRTRERFLLATFLVIASSNTSAATPPNIVFIIELSDLKTDISEKRDLSESSPELTARIHQNLEAWRETMNAPMPEPRTP